MHRSRALVIVLGFVAGADNVVWTVSDGQLNNELRRVSLGIKEFGELTPDPPTPQCVVAR
jgi:hypothetical protein